MCLIYLFMPIVQVLDGSCTDHEGPSLHKTSCSLQGHKQLENMGMQAREPIHACMCTCTCLKASKLARAETTEGVGLYSI